MKRYFIHNPFFRLLAPPVYGVLVYLLILLINNNVTQINDIVVSQEVYVCIGLMYVSFESIRIIIVLLDKFLPGKYFGIRVPIQFIITPVVSLALVFVGLHLYFQQALGFSMSGGQWILFAVLYTVTALLYNILYFSNHYLQKENTLKLTLEKQQRDTLELEMLEFKNDINPDLLYESLESLINLMYRDVEQAEEYIDALASAYRYVLSNRHQELVPVRVELDAARNLVTLLNEKYFGLLTFEASLGEDALDMMLIPGSLPIVVESIVRNTIVSRFEPLTIRCYVEEDYLTVQSKLNDRLIPHANTAQALERLQRSYTLYSDQAMVTVKAYEENYIKLPVIRVTEEIELS